MSDKVIGPEECKGCFLLENEVYGICQFNPHPTEHTSCPCIECIVKSMCNTESGCWLFTKAYYSEMTEVEI